MKMRIKVGLMALLACLMTIPDQGIGALVSRQRSLFTEQQKVMGHAAEAMKAHHDRHGEYPREWRQLSVNWYGWPTLQNRDLWQPKNCQFVYKIVAADRDHFLIQALGWEDRPIAEIREGMKKPMDLPGAEIKLKKLDADTPEPKLFLPVAAAAMRAARENGALRYPAEWKLLKITYSAIPYRTYSLGIHPNESDTEDWRPRGCRYRYVITQADRDHFLIEAKGRAGTVEYEIRDGMTEAKFLRNPNTSANIIE